ncbi:MAG TPA: hypothetical protein VFL91_18960 [Thermomicrobiales bacterium]|nr:hypothetical protein [Thermomicrobiales bacterium]
MKRDEGLHMVGARVSTREWRVLREAAFRRDCSVAEVIRHLVREEELRLHVADAAPAGGAIVGAHTRDLARN